MQGGGDRNGSGGRRRSGGREDPSSARLRAIKQMLSGVSLCRAGPLSLDTWYIFTNISMSCLADRTLIVKVWASTERVRARFYDIGVKSIAQDIVRDPISCWDYQRYEHMTAVRVHRVVRSSW